MKMNDCMFLLIFNPSNDMALAADAQMYVPPRNVRQMEKDLELLEIVSISRSMCRSLGDGASR